METTKHEAKTLCECSYASSSAYDFPDRSLQVCIHRPLRGQLDSSAKRRCTPPVYLGGAAARIEDWSCIRHARGCRPLAAPCVTRLSSSLSSVRQGTEAELTSVTVDGIQASRSFPRKIKKFSSPANHADLTTSTLYFPEIESLTSASACPRAGKSTQHWTWGLGILAAPKVHHQGLIATSLALRRRGTKPHVNSSSREELAHHSRVYLNGLLTAAIKTFFICVPSKRPFEDEEWPEAVLKFKLHRMWSSAWRIL